MHSDCHTNEPGSIVWQSEHTLICSDGTLSHCTLALHAHRHSSHIHQPYFSHPECPLVQSAPPPPPTPHTPHTHTHTQVLHPSMGPLTQGSTYLGVHHTVL